MTADVLSVPCAYCHAKEGEPCTNMKTKTPLFKAPAHPCRCHAVEPDPQEEWWKK